MPEADTILRVETLGRVQVTRGGESISRSLNAKTLALLIYLVVTARSQSREHLATLLWGEMNEQEAQTNLRKALSLLRPIAGPALLFEKSTVEFDPTAPHWLDVRELEHAAENLERAGKSGAPTSNLPANEAAGLYRGEFLAGLVVKNAPDFEVWVLEERERYRLLAVQVLEKAIQEGLTAGASDAALAALDRLLALDVWNERAYRQKMMLLAKRGQKLQALAQYSELRKILSDEFGVEPTEETTTLFERIRDAKPFQAAFPIFPTAFLGRARELAVLAQDLPQPTPRLVTLLGPGGVGKTRLATHAAQLYASQFLHGVAYVPLREAESEDDLLRAIATGVQLVLRSSGSPLDQLSEFLRDKQALLVLDNFEQIVSTAPLLSKLLTAAPELKLLVTSRTRLALQWEHVLNVDGLDYARGEASDAGQLFLQRARSIGTLPGISEEINQAITRICRAVGGFPLGLELAAGLTHTLTYQALADQIEAGLGSLTSDLRDTESRHVSLRAVFESTWRSLTGTEQQVLPRLSVFRGGFELEAAQSVARASSTLLASLLDKALIRQIEPGRFEMHQVLREFADERLAQNGVELSETLARHAAYYLEFLQARRERIEGAAQVATLAEIRAEYENVRAAWQWTTEHGELAALDIAAPVMYRYHEAEGTLREGRELFRPLQDLSRIARARFGACQVFMYETAEARELITGALAQARAAGDAFEVVFCLIQLGNIGLELSNFEDGTSNYREALEISRAQELPGMEITALNNLGLIAGQRGETENARALFQESLEVAQRIGEERGVGIGWLNLGFVDGNAANYESARMEFERALPIFEHTNDRRGLSMTLGNLGEIALIQERLEDAENLYRQSLLMYRELALPEKVANMIRNLASVAFKRNAFEEAHRLYQQALSEYHRIGARFGECYALTGLGDVALAQHQLSEARDFFVDELRLAQTIQAKPRALDALYGLAQVAEQAGNLPRARALYRYLVQHPATGGSVRSQATARLNALLPDTGAGAVDREQDWGPIQDLITEFQLDAPV